MTKIIVSLSLILYLYQEKFSIMTNFERDKSTWAIGGTTMLGVGIGLILLQTSAIWFVGSIIAGIGLGLVITSIISKKRID